MGVQWWLVFNLASTTATCHWASHFPDYSNTWGYSSRCTYWPSRGFCWCSQLYWGHWIAGSCQSFPVVQCHHKFSEGALSVQVADDIQHVLSIHPWHTLPLLIQDRLWHFTMVTQDKIQSLERQMGIFSMILPVAQWLRSLDMIKLWLVAPSCLSTGRSSFKQLFLWSRHRQQRITHLARSLTSLG